jgi:hypothetical protein
VDKLVKDDPGGVSLFDFFYFRSLKGEQIQVEGAPKDAIVMGDYLLLTALHVITREHPDWVWTTFWWDANPSEIADRPDWVAKDEKLKHFNMRITIQKASEAGPQPVFNPYLEGTHTSGTRSNCISCHRNAAVLATRDGTSFQLTARPVPSMSQPAPQADCLNAICTSLIWSLARRSASLGH